VVAGDVPPLIADGRKALLRLFDHAASSLRERGIAMTYDSATISWLFARSEWQSSLNPLLTLKCTWRQKVAVVIEDLLLCGQLNLGDTLWVAVKDASDASEIQFVVSPATE